MFPPPAIEVQFIEELAAKRSLTVQESKKFIVPLPDIVNTNGKEDKASFEEHIDASIIVSFPPDFFQKGIRHVIDHPDEQFVMQITENRVYLRRMKLPIAGVRPKDAINGRIITWTPI